MFEEMAEWVQAYEATPKILPVLLRRVDDRTARVRLVPGDWSLVGSV
jgi:hypothetical protein